MLVFVLPQFLKGIKQVLTHSLDLSEFPVRVRVVRGSEAMLEVVCCGLDVAFQVEPCFANHLSPLIEWRSVCHFRQQLLILLLSILLVEPEVLLHHLSGIHGAELRSAHRAEGGILVIVIGQGFVVHGAGGLGI
jgi:hypothetical protein